MAKSHIEKLVDEALAIEAEAAKEAGTLGYMARALVQATMPHKRVLVPSYDDPKRMVDSPEFSRKNGAFTLVMLSPSEIGLPYGAIPRLIMSWITTEAVKTKNKEIILGDSLSAFMRELGLVPTGGRWGSITRLKEQMKKLMAAAISCTYDDGQNWGIRNVQPIEQANLWWNPKQPDQATIWQSNLILNDSFFNEVITNPIPVDMRVLKAIKRSPMALDIYCWLTYRMSYLKKQTEIPWAALQAQFGSGYAKNAHGIRNFKGAFLRELKKVRQFYAGVRADSGEYGLILKPSISHIPKRPKVQLTNREKEKSTPKESNDILKKLHQLYTQYCHTRLSEIVKKEIEESDKKSLLNEFSIYLKRNQVKGVNPHNLDNSQTQEWLYRFVNNNWHHLINQIKSFDDFNSSETE